MPLILKKIFANKQMDKLDASLIRIIIFGVFCVIWAFMLPVPTYGQTTLEDAGWTAGSVDNETGNTIYEYPNMNDDGYAVVPLQFAFPFFGQTFSMSFMWDNGLVSFYDPTANVGCNPSNAFCGGHNWNGSSGFNNTGFSYFIAPMWADMKPSPDGQTKYLTSGDSTYQRYVWKDITEFYSNGSRDSTFGLEIRADGSFDSL